MGFAILRLEARAIELWSRETKKVTPESWVIQYALSGHISCKFVHFGSAIVGFSLRRVVVNEVLSELRFLEVVREGRCCLQGLLTRFNRA